MDNKFKFKFSEYIVFYADWDKGVIHVIPHDKKIPFDTDSHRESPISYSFSEYGEPNECELVVQNGIERNPDYDHLTTATHIGSNQFTCIIGTYNNAKYNGDYFATTSDNLTTKAEIRDVAAYHLSRAMLKLKPKKKFPTPEYLIARVDLKNSNTDKTMTAETNGKQVWLDFTYARRRGETVRKAYATVGGKLMEHAATDSMREYWRDCTGSDIRCNFEYSFDKSAKRAYLVHVAGVGNALIDIHGMECINLAYPSSPNMDEFVRLMNTVLATGTVKFNNIYSTIASQLELAYLYPL